MADEKEKDPDRRPSGDRFDTYHDKKKPGRERLERTTQDEPRKKKDKKEK